ncbi:hypothetical protein N1851_009769 [Merluccius polli]|uniref:Myb/SANT-like DNA-binding domain-containing protein n=1 Tax=Merluccius polli TaxID=89951 RepID=A0AA47MZC5_MERPO|nr:hypothetical protein N1851_009769 [Merluccius polli]
MSALHPSQSRDFTNPGEDQAMCFGVESDGQIDQSPFDFKWAGKKKLRSYASMKNIGLRCLHGDKMSHILRSTHLKADYVITPREGCRNSKAPSNAAFKCVLLFPLFGGCTATILRSLPYPKILCAPVFSGGKITMATPSGGSKEQTELLIKIRGHNDLLFTGAKHSATVGWRTILEKMGLEGKVQPHQAKKKWDNLKKKYEVGAGLDLFYPCKLLNTLLKIADVIDFHCLRIANIQAQGRGQDRGLLLPPPVLIASIPEDTPGPSAIVGDHQGDEEEEEEESQPGPSRKRRREDDLFSLIKEDMRLQREAEERREQEIKERMERLFCLLVRIREAVLFFFHSGLEATSAFLVFFDDELDLRPIEMLFVPEHGVARHIGSQTAGERCIDARVKQQLARLNRHRTSSQTCTETQINNAKPPHRQDQDLRSRVQNQKPTSGPEPKTKTMMTQDPEMDHPPWGGEVRVTPSPNNAVGKEQFCCLRLSQGFLVRES